jgi:spore maturation protein CgeB
MKATLVDKSVAFSNRNRLLSVASAKTAPRSRSRNRAVVPNGFNPSEDVSPALVPILQPRPIAADSARGNGGGRGASPLKIVVLGLSITSSWGNGHATTYRALIKELAARGHQVLFLERNLKWYAANRDLPKPPYCRLALYDTLKQLKDRFRNAIRNADLVIVGSYVPEGIEIGEWVTRVAGGATAFYDIDTPVTMAKLRSGNLDYVSAGLIPCYTMYLSFTGGPTLDVLTRKYGAFMARPLYCSVDETLYFPEDRRIKWDLGYMGTFSNDRQPALEELLLRPARAWGEGSFVVAGPQYPKEIRWPKNVKRFTHLPPEKHRAFYNQQRFTLNLTREQMIEAGYSPSVRLFEAAACGTPIISDLWEGLDTFFRPGEEILIGTSEEMVMNHLLNVTEEERKGIGAAARQCILHKHTAKHRAAELESYALEALRK